MKDTATNQDNKSKYGGTAAVLLKTINQRFLLDLVEGNRDSCINYFPPLNDIYNTVFPALLF